jgi:hypothetical protein
MSQVCFLFFLSSFLWIPSVRVGPSLSPSFHPHSWSSDFRSVHPSQAATPTQSVVVGVNVYDEGFLSPPEQDAEIERLAENGVKTIRTGLSDKSVYFITQAFRHGIGSVAIVFPTWGSQARTKLRWSDAPLSGADPAGICCVA